MAKVIMIENKHNIVPIMVFIKKNVHQDKYN